MQSVGNRVGNGGGVKSQWGSGALVVRLTAEGKKLYLWHEVLVLMGRSLLPEGGVQTVCVPGERDRLQSFLPASGSWRRTGPGETVDCSQSPSEQSG